MATNTQQVLEKAFPGIAALATEVATLRNENEALKARVESVTARKEHYKAIATGRNGDAATVAKAVKALRDQARVFRSFCATGYGSKLIADQRAAVTKVMADTLAASRKSPAVKALRDALRPFRDQRPPFGTGSAFIKKNQPNIKQVMADTLAAQNGAY